MILDRILKRGFGSARQQCQFGVQRVELEVVVVGRAGRGQGPRYPLLPKSLRPSVLPSGGRAPSPMSVAVAGMLNTIQCTKGLPGASGSMTVSARLFVPSGTPLQLRGGETSAPLHVYRAGIAAPWPKAWLVNVMELGIVASCPQATRTTAIAMSGPRRAWSTPSARDVQHGVGRAACVAQ